MGISKYSFKNSFQKTYEKGTHYSKLKLPFTHAKTFKNYYYISIRNNEVYLVKKIFY